MPTNTVCRLCLVSDVKTFVIANKSLQTIYEKLTNTPLVIGDNRPMVACCACYAQLYKCYELMLNARFAQEYFTLRLEDIHQVTALSSRTCKADSLRSTLKMTPVQYFDTSTFDVPIMVKDDLDCKDVKLDVELEFQEFLDKLSQNLPVCRICLATGLRMCSIHRTPLQFVYEKLTDFLLETDDKKPMSVCYICYARLNKCRKLMIRSSKADKVLTALIQKYSKVTKKMIAMIDREENNLCAPLKIRPAECCDSFEEHPLKPALLDVEVKIEVEPDVYVGSPQDIDVDSPDPGQIVEAWNIETPIQEDGTSIEKPKRRRRKRCTKNDVEINETNENETIKEKPRRVYKKRIRAYIHVCEICQRVFNRTNHLKDHMKIHTDDRPYQCTVCQRRFIQKVNLKNHMMTHTGEKPFECHICQSGFIARSDFKRHMNTHNEERNFICNICQRGFTQMPYLKAHMGTHTSEKPYECHICQRRFSQKPYLKNHIKRHVS